MTRPLRFTTRRTERGNVFAMLFGAVALTGVLAAVSMQTLTGPVTTITRVTQRNVAENNLLMNGKILINAAVAGVSGGDADADGIIEPAPFIAPGGGEAAPGNGGFLPTDLGLALTDPWGTKYGYCVWDHGTTNTSANRITGDDTASASTQPVIAIIAAGPDKTFQTSCPAWSGGPVTVSKASGSDDLIEHYTYAEATASSNGLWSLNASDQAKAELKDSGGTARVTIDRSTGVGDFLGITTDTLVAKTSNVTLDGGLKLDTETNVTICAAGDAGVIRFNAASGKLEVCNGTAWRAAGSDLWLENGTHIYSGNTGNVGIGTNAPAQKLDVVGNAVISGDVGAGGNLAVTGTGTITGAATLGDTLSVTGAATLSSTLAVTGAATLSSTLDVTGNTTIDSGTLFVDAANNRVGVGTATPVSQLQVGAQIPTYSPAATIRTDTPEQTALRVQSGGGTASAFAAHKSSDSSVLFDIKDSGNVGIGTDTPSYLLDVNGTARIVGAATLSNTLSVAGNTAIDIDTLFVDVAANTVGIGTTTPAARLDVAGGIKVGADAVCNASKAGMVAWNTNQFQVCDGTAFRNVSAIEKLDDIGDVYVSEAGTPNNNDILAWDSTNTRWVAKNVNTVGSAVATPGGLDKQVQFNDGGTLAGAAQLYWDKTNNRLGIGTASPTSPLHLSNGNVPAASLVTTDKLIVAYEDVSAGITGIVTSNANSVFRPVFKGVRARGTLAAPTAVLNNDEITTVLSAAYDGTTGQATAGIFFRADGNASSGVAPQRISFLTSETDAAARTEKLTIKANGAVGIGTATPQSLLHVAGGIQLGDDTATCPGAGNIKLGTLRFNAGALQVCTATGWGSISSGGVSCPGGFTQIAAQGRVLGCMQTNENAVATWPTAASACFVNYGGRLPTSAEWYLAAANYSLSNETGNWEWLSDAVGETSNYDNHAVVGSTAITDFSWGYDTTNSFAYRCFIPASSGGAASGSGGSGGKFVDGDDPDDAVYTDGKVGIGTTAPASLLDVAGGIRLGDDTGQCTTAKAGTMRFSLGSMQICVNEDWADLAVVSGLAPAPTEDPPFTNSWPDAVVCSTSAESRYYYANYTEGGTGYRRYKEHNNNNQLIFDSTGDFVSIGISATDCENKDMAVLVAAGQTYSFKSGTPGTMRSSWPDVIRCTYSGAYRHYYLNWYNATSVRYREFQNGYVHDFATGTQTENNRSVSTDCNTQTIAQLYSSGQAFNMVGGDQSGAMDENFPDALVCTDGVGDQHVMLRGYTPFDSYARYHRAHNSNNIYIDFRLDTRMQIAGGENLSGTADCEGRTLDQLRTQGKAFFFADNAAPAGSGNSDPGIPPSGSGLPIVAGWPDIIICKASGNIDYVLRYANAADTGLKRYRTTDQGTWADFNDNGTANSNHSNLNATDCAGKSISQLESAGQTKNYKTAVAESEIMPGWPDVLDCVYNNNNRWPLLYAYGNATHVYYYARGSYYVRMFRDGTYNTHSHNTTCNGKSIAQLYAAGQALNFYGGTDNGSMVVGLPDAISCTVTTNGGKRVYFRSIYYYDNSTPYYSTSNGDSELRFNGFAPYTYNTGGSGTDCVNKSIAQLNVEGKSVFLVSTNNSGQVPGQYVPAGGSMVNGWPDAVMCRDGANKPWVYWFAYQDASTTYYHSIGDGTTVTYRYLNFNNNKTASASSPATECSGASISELESLGLTFNLTGGGGGGATTLNALSNVNIVSPTTGQVLTYDGANWVNQGAPSGSVAGTVAGAVQFRGPSAVFEADDVNLVWDDVNDRLGIGTATPDETMHLAGPIAGVELSPSTASGVNALIRFNSTAGTGEGGLFYNQDNDSLNLMRSINTAAINGLSVSASGDIGIGTISPSTPLEVVGTIKAALGLVWSANGSTATSRSLLLENFDDTANANGVDIGVKLGGTEFQGLSWVQETAWTSGSAAADKDVMLQLGVLNDNTAANRVFIKANGNVGIGTDSPSYKLEVKDGALRINNSAGSDADIRFTNNASTAGRISYSGQEMQFFTAGGQRIVITATGNVGIGTTSPNAVALLDLTSTTKGLLLPRLTTTQVNNIPTPPDGLVVYDADIDAVKVRANGGWVALSTGGGGGGGSSQWSDGSGGEIYYNGGSVGIGTTDPDNSAALHVSSTSKGFLPPRMTTAQRDAIPSPAPGIIVYNTSVNQLQFYNGANWLQIGSDVSTISTVQPRLLSWGRASAGALGNGTTSPSIGYPGLVSSPPSNIVMLSAGGYFQGSDGAACALTNSGALYCWGRGAHIGDGDNTDETTPKLTATGYTWKQVSVGSGLTTCAVDTNDDAYCWGYQQYNALGNGVNSGAYLYTPQAVLGGHKWQMISMAGRYNGSNHIAHGCGITLAGDAYCWGNDSYGQQGNGAGSHNYTTPGIVSGGHNWVMLSARVYHTCGITSAGEGYCWGEGANGRLGNGGTADMQEPALISGGYTWSQIVTGEDFSCGITTDKDAYCWGNGGRLGDGTSTQKTVPTSVVGGKKWLKLAAGPSHTCGLDVTHHLYCWGSGSNGELGTEDGSTTALVPRRVYGDDTYSDFAAAFGTTIGLTQ